MGSIESQAAAAFDAQQMTVDCPKCTQKITKNVGFFRTHKEMQCAGCGDTITLDVEGLNRGYQQALQGARELDRQLSKPIKLNLKF